ncbi:MAG: response regulator, partial [Deltaproteobacteria bacterium]|nr:response regulator [Deltaproteobacteria bacterium]
MSDLSKKQLEQLAAVFRSEAVEHIKALAEIMFTLEEGGGDFTDLLNRAFREAHSLKGSAGTLGFERVEVVTHRMEDVLGALKVRDDTLTDDALDTLLTALDVVRKAAESSLPGDATLTNAEQDAITALDELALAVDSAIAERPSNPPASIPPGPRTSEAPPSGSQPPGSQMASAPDVVGREEFVRVAESRLDSVVGQVGELFETGLQLESIGHDLRSVATSANQVVEDIAVLVPLLDGNDIEARFIQLSEKMRNLQIQLRGTSKQYDQEEYLLTKLIQRAQSELREIRLAPISTLFVSIRSQVREIAKLTGKRVEVRLSGGEYAVDRKVLDAIADPLIHILRNAVDHGIEDAHVRKSAGKKQVGLLTITARHTGDAVELTISDDGRGIDPENIRRSLIDSKQLTTGKASELSPDQLYDYLFESGFSTRKDVSKLSGRGVGLDVVKYTIERLGGEVRMESARGRGTAIALLLPLSMSTMRCLLVRVAGRPMAIPASNVEKVVVVGSDELRQVGGGDVILHDDLQVPFTSLAEILGLGALGRQEIEGRTRLAALVRFGDRRFAFGIDEIIEYAQLILKPLGDLLERVPNISGMSLLGTGELALVLNPGDLVRSAGGAVVARATTSLVEGEQSGPPRILVVDDSIATRTLEKTLLESAGFRVLTAADGYKALDILGARHVELVISDVQMPNMDGFELTQAIKSRPTLSHLPVILVTSLGSSEDKARGM